MSQAEPISCSPVRRRGGIVILPGCECAVKASSIHSVTAVHADTCSVDLLMLETVVTLDVGATLSQVVLAWHDGLRFDYYGDDSGVLEVDAYV